MSSSAEEMRVSHSTLVQLGRAVFSAVGVPDADADITSKSLVDADLRGVHSHGMQRLPWYVSRLQQGGTNVQPAVQVVEQGPSTGLIDGDGGLGQVVSHRAMQLAIQKSESNGIGCVAVRNSHHFGACGYWVRMAMPGRKIGIATTNGGCLMAPWGGRTPTTSNDPIGVAVPAGDLPPIVLDMATTIVAGGTLDLLARQGKKIPLDWALDREGQPTDDPASARQGLILPIGQHKGYGLTVVFEILAAVLSGANVGREVPPATAIHQPMNVGHYFQVIDISRFLPVEVFEQRVAGFIQQIKSAQRMPGTKEIFLPGEIEHRKEQQYRRDGIPLHPTVVDELNLLATRLKITAKLESM